MSPSGPLVTLGWVTPEPRVTFAGVSPGALRHAPLPAPRPRGLACRGRGRDRLSVPAPLSFSPPTACRLPRRPPLPPPPDTPPATLSPPRDHAWLGGRRAPDPPVPLNASRHPPPAAPGARGPRPPPPARRCAALCGGARGAAGGRPRPLHFFQECTPPRYPPGVFPGGPLSGLPVSPSGPLVTLGWVTPEPRVTFAGVSPGALRHAPLPAPRPRGLACRGRGRDRLSVPAPLSFSPPTACRLPRRPPLPPPPDTPPATLSPPRDHAWLGGRRAPDPPVPLNASRHPPPAAPGARGPRPPPPARRCAALCGGARGAAGGRPRPLHFFQECTPPIPPGGLSWGAFVRVACVTQRPLGHAWLGHPGAPGHVCRGQPWGPSSRSAARAPPPGACLPRPGARPPLCPRPPVILPSNGVQAPAPPPAPAPTRHAPCDPVPSSRSRMAGRAPRPRPPRSPERQPPSTARSPRSPRTPTPPPRPPLRRAVRGG